MELKRNGFAIDSIIFQIRLGRNMEGNISASNNYDGTFTLSARIPGGGGPVADIEMAAEVANLIARKAREVADSYRAFKCNMHDGKDFYLWARDEAECSRYAHEAFSEWLTELEEQMDTATDDVKARLRETYTRVDRYWQIGQLSFNWIALPNARLV